MSLKNYLKMYELHMRGSLLGRLVLLWPSLACTMLWIYFDSSANIPTSQRALAYLAHLLYKPIIPLPYPGFLLVSSTFYCFCHLPGRAEGEEDLLGPALWDSGSERRREHHRAVQKEKEGQESKLSRGARGTPCGELQFFRMSRRQRAHHSLCLFCIAGN